MPDDIDSFTCATVIYRDGQVATDWDWANVAYWHIDESCVASTDIIGYKIEDDSACGVNN